MGSKNVDLLPAFLHISIAVLQALILKQIVDEFLLTNKTTINLCLKHYLPHVYADSTHE